MGQDAVAVALSGRDTRRDATRENTVRHAMRYGVLRPRRCPKLPPDVNERKYILQWVAVGDTQSFATARRWLIDPCVRLRPRVDAFVIGYGHAMIHLCSAAAAR